MFRRISLRSFQAWEAVDVPLSPITVIVGETHSGKSSILRALSALMFNALEGTSMVRKGGTVATATLEMDSGDVIEWARGASVNRYTLNDVVLDKPGRAVPVQVQDTLNIHELEFDGESVRLQWAPQLDAPFLLSDSGAKATRMLGVVGKAAVLAQAVRIAQGESREASATLNASRIQSASLEDAMRTFDYVEAAAPFAATLRERMADLESARALRDQKAQTISELTAVQHKLRAAKARKDILAKSVQELAVIVDAYTVVSDLQRVHSLRSSIVTHNVALGTKTATVTALTGMMDEYERLSALALVLKDMHTLRRIRDELAGTQARFVAKAREGIAHKRELDDMLASFTCPTCGQLR